MIFTVRKYGTSSLSHFGSQTDKHFVDSSFCGTGATSADSSSSDKAVASGSSGLCSGRKNLLTCSSVLKWALAKAMARKKVTRKPNAFILWCNIANKRVKARWRSLLRCEPSCTENPALLNLSFISLERNLSSFVINGIHCHFGCSTVLTSK